MQSLARRGVQARSTFSIAGGQPATSRMRMGSSRGPRIWPTLHRTSPASSKRGKRATNSSMATFSSSRARFEPRQRWMPSPNAAWRFSCAVDDERVRVLELERIAVGCRERQQHPVVLLHRAAVEVDVLGDHARHRDRGVGAEELLERERHHRRGRRGGAAGRRGAGRGATATSRSPTTWCRCRR